MPETAEDRLKVADFLYKGMTAAGVKPEDAFFMILWLSQSVLILSMAGKSLILYMKYIKDIQAYTQLLVLSNISFGLPNRKLLNQAFLVMCTANGMDGVILDPLDEGIMSLAVASEALVARDDYCMNYITAQA